MANDILIDLGPKWGHVVPLSSLEHISHIEITEDGKITISCDPIPEMKRRAMTYKSRRSFEEEELEVEKNRILGFSNGIVSRDDVEKILAAMTAQTGVETEEVLSEPVYDIAFLRRLWATHMGLPYFRFTLQYDPETDNVMVAEDHNELFMPVIPKWCDDVMLDHLPDDAKLLLFAYEVLYGMAEPILPEPEDGLITDPYANVPTMGVRGAEVKQQVDLANTNSDQIMVSSE